MSNEKFQQKNLVDVLVVILKHRWFIITISATTLFVTTLIFFVLPAMDIHLYQKDKVLYQAEFRSRLPRYDQETKRYVEFDLDSAIQEYLSDTAFISEIYRPYAHASEKQDDLKYFRFIKSKVIGSYLQSSNDAGLITIRFTSNEEDLTRMFMEDLVRELRIRMRADAEKSIFVSIQSLDLVEQRFINTLQSLLDKTFRDDRSPVVRLVLQELNGPLLENLHALAMLQSIRQRLQITTEQDNYPWAEEKSFVVSINDGRSDPGMLSAIIIGFGVMFSVLMAFVLDNVQGIRHDEMEMAKLRSAFERNGKPVGR